MRSPKIIEKLAYDFFHGRNKQNGPGREESNLTVFVTYNCSKDANSKGKYAHRHRHSYEHISFKQ